MRTSTAAVGTFIGAGLLLGPASPAVADPPRETLALACSNGHALTVATAPANGTFTPVFDTDSTSVFTPTSINATLKTYDGTGALIDTQTSTQLLGRGNAGRGAEITCTAAETITSAEDPTIPIGGHRDISVEITGSFTPRNP